jgi:hypothetical protein
MALFAELKRRKKKPTSFIREAFREKIAIELPKIIAAENIKKSNDYCPF